MSRSRGGNSKTAGDDPQSEVEQLLRAAEDDLLLKLRVSAHTSSSSLDPDLARRLETLKSPPPPPPSAVAPKPLEKGGASEAPADDGDWGKILGDDLAARFAALKGSSSGPGGSGLEPERSDLMAPEGKGCRGDGEEVEEEDDGDAGEDGVSKKEVDKLLQWAMDAARLDPSKSDDDEDGDGGGSSEDEEEGEEDLEVKKKKVGEERDKKNKGKPKKWFFF